MTRTILALWIVSALGGAAAAAPRIIYLNPVGGLIVPGADDSRTNTSSIVDAPVELSAFPYSDASWAEVVTCTRGLFAPYNMEITDVDPGNTPHIEAVIAGAAAEAGYTETLGIAPHDCSGIVENAMVYAFAVDIGDNPRELCETAAQEIAHAFTLDHELDCHDPMTYLDDCGPKQFLDTEVECGESTPRTCWCGGTTQNSHQVLLSLAGPGAGGGDGDDGGGDEPSAGGGCNAGGSRGSLLILLAFVPLLRCRHARRAAVGMLSTSVFVVACGGSTSSSPTPTVESLVIDLANKPVSVLADPVRVHRCDDKTMDRAAAAKWMTDAPLVFPDDQKCSGACCDFTPAGDDVNDFNITVSRVCTAGGKVTEIHTVCEHGQAAPTPTSPVVDSASIPAAWQTCTKDADCERVQTTCCDECNAGTAVAVNKPHAASVKQTPCTPTQYCTEVFCVTRAACDAGRCAIERG